MISALSGIWQTIQNIGSFISQLYQDIVDMLHYISNLWQIWEGTWWVSLLPLGFGVVFAVILAIKFIKVIK